MPFTIDHAPIRTVTPMNTPIVENTLFSFCARIIWSASRIASKKGTLRRLQLVRGDHAVAQRDDPGGVGRNVVLVRDHDDRLAPAVQGAEHLHQLGAGGRVEVSGGLVGEEDGGLVHEGAGDRDALALPARQLVGPVVHPVAQPDAGERPGGLLAPLARRLPRVDQRQLHVVERRRTRQQVEGLEDESDLLVADAGQLVIGQIAHLLPVQPVFARRGCVQAADQVHERRLARTRRPHHRDVSVLADLQAPAPHGAHHLASPVGVARELVGQDHDVGQRRVARPERLQGRHAVFFTILFAVSAACFAGRTRAPSFRSRIAWYGPATIVSSSFRPSSTSKYSSPAIPTLTGRNVAVPLFTTKTPSVSFFLRAVVVSTGRFSVDTGLFSRTVSAMIGIESACLRVSVTMRAVAERSGRTSPGGLVKVISTW